MKDSETAAIKPDLTARKICAAPLVSQRCSFLLCSLILFIIMCGWIKAAKSAETTLSVRNDSQSRTRNNELADGAAIYNYFCYQCHGYAGDAQTLASRYLVPPPRDFISSSPSVLSESTMQDAVRKGRPGTAMMSFSRVLDDQDVTSVVQYIRQSFMQGEPSGGRYHTPANGWPSDGRQTAADPYVAGELRVDIPIEDLTDRQRRGRDLFLNACVSCHERPQSAASSATWRPRSVSFPRRHYSHRAAEFDAITGATLLARHNQAPRLASLNDAERRGESLFLANCAFCHAADGTGRNWIGSFLEPSPLNLTEPSVATMTTASLQTIIRDGKSGTSMPAWGDVFTRDEIDDLVTYVFRVLRGQNAAALTEALEGPDEVWTPMQMPTQHRLGWQRRPKISKSAVGNAANESSD